MRYFVAIAALAILSSACEEADRPVNAFSLKSADKKGTTPDHFVLLIRNNLKTYLCFSKSELDPEQGTVHVTTSNERSSSGPPPDTRLGLEVSDGLWVVPPLEEKTIFIPLRERITTEAKITGFIRGIDCAEMFTKKKPRTFQENIEFSFSD